MNENGMMYIGGYRKTLETYAGRTPDELMDLRNSARNLKKTLAVGSMDWHGVVGILTALNVLLGEN